MAFNAYLSIYCIHHEITNCNESLGLDGLSRRGAILLLRGVSMILAQCVYDYKNIDFETFNLMLLLPSKTEIIEVIEEKGRPLDQFSIYILSLIDRDLHLFSHTAASRDN